MGPIEPWLRDYIDAGESDVFFDPNLDIKDAIWLIFIILELISHSI